jgi:uncharacterized protein (DUF302 family)
MIRTIASLALVLFLVSVSFADNGLVSVKSSHNVKDTTDRLVQALESKGMTVFNRINHAEGAKKVGSTMLPTELVIFGNPKVGTPLMVCSRSVAIDLPQKALIWEDAQGQAWLVYNDPAYLAERHGITDCKEVLQKVAGALKNFAAAATQP